MASFAALDRLLEPVVEQVIQLLQIRDNSTNELAVTDPVVVVAARNAYHQSVSYIGRDLTQQTFTESYPIGCGKINMKNTPVTEVLNVWSVDNELDEELLVEGTDYEVVRNRYLKIESALVDTADAFLKGTSAVLLIEVIVEYTGGYSSLPNSILSGLVLQTLANYNRIAVVGVTKVEGQLNSAVSSAASPDLLVSDARVVLDSFKYYGDAVAQS